MPAVPQRHQIRLSSRVGGVKDADRVRSLRMTAPSGLRVAGRSAVRSLLP